MPASGESGQPMPTPALLTESIVFQVLAQLHPMDRAIGKRLLGRAATERLPDAAFLASHEARPFWHGAFLSLSLRASDAALDISAGRRLGELLPSENQLGRAADLPLSHFTGSIQELENGKWSWIEPADSAEPEGARPLVLRRSPPLLYFQRWFMMERALAEAFRERLQRPPEPLPADLGIFWKLLFRESETWQNPWQAAACLSALRHPLTILTGGPGTGKTTTVTRLILLLQQLPDSRRPQLIRLVAQTGKAADRLRESLHANLSSSLAALSDPERRTNTENKLATCDIKISTIHRLLGAQGRGSFRHGPRNPLRVDLLVVDEATMVDMELFHKLISATPPQSRVVLLGDKNQLSAIETGNVFADLTFSDALHDRQDAAGSLNRFSEDFRTTFAKLCGCPLPLPSTDEVATLGDAVVELRHSYRFAADSPVARLARHLLRTGELPSDASTGVTFVPSTDDWETTVSRHFEPYRQALEAGDNEAEVETGGRRVRPCDEKTGGRGVSPSTLLGLLLETRILCAVRGGDFGCERVNQIISRLLPGSSGESQQPQHGLPLMITRNDPETGLWNGDCGLFALDPAQPDSSELYAWFPGEAPEAPPRQMPVSVLPEWEPAFAITIHKSQGSEYDRVCVILPDNCQSFISWEMVYTAVTRARHELTLVVPPGLRGCHLPRNQRHSGLRAELGL